MDDWNFKQISRMHMSFPRNSNHFRSKTTFLHIIKTTTIFNERLIETNVYVQHVMRESLGKSSRVFTYASSSRKAD